LSTDLPDILGSSLPDYLDPTSTRFPILEQSPPNLCADRVDYFLRDLIALKIGFSTHQDRITFVHQFLSHLIIYQNQMCLTSLSIGLEACRLYMKLNLSHYISPKDCACYYLTTLLLKRAMSLGCITELDLDTLGDDEIWKRITNESKIDLELKSILDLIMNSSLQFRWIPSSSNQVVVDADLDFNPKKKDDDSHISEHELIQSGWKILKKDIKLKMRYIDPFIVMNPTTSTPTPTTNNDYDYYQNSNGNHDSSTNENNENGCTVKRVSELDQEFRNELNIYLQKGLIKYSLWYK